METLRFAVLEPSTQRMCSNSILTFTDFFHTTCLRRTVWSLKHQKVGIEVRLRFESLLAGVN